MIEELKEGTLQEHEDERRERRADLLVLQITNVIEHETAIENVSTPSVV